jgi:DNA-binding beta-propeller fold protein YncE
MNVFRSAFTPLLVIGALFSQSVGAADLIVSANDGKYVRVEGVSTYPQPAPSDSLAVIDASQFPPKVTAVVEGIEHTIAGPPQAVAITPDGKLAIIGAPSKYDYAAKKESFGTFLQRVDLEASPPRLLGRVEIGAHPNRLSIHPEGTLLLAAGLDGTLKVLTIAGQEVKLANSIKVGDKRLSGVSFTHDGKAALVALRDEGGLAVLTVDGPSVTLTKERVSTGIAPYGIDISSDGKWAVVGGAGLAGLPGQLAPGDADLITLIDVSKRPFRAVQHLTVPATPEAVALSPDGNWIVAQTLNGSNLTPNDPGSGRQKLGRIVLFAIRDGVATRVNDLPSGEAGQGAVFAKDNKTILVQFNVEKALGVYQIRDDRLVDTGERLKLDAGPASIRATPR